MPLVLGVDSSTQSTKVELRDADDGRLVATGRAPHPPTAPPRSEQDPEAWWAALRQAVRALPDHEIAAVAIAAQQMGLVTLDAAGLAVRPAKLWNDTESAPDAAWLLGRFGGPAAWAAACGSVPTAAFTITKLSWVHRSEPEVFARLAHVCLPHDWLTWRLSGELVTDRGDASGTGYWSSTDGWRTDLLDIVDGATDWAGALPRVGAPAERAGFLTAEAADALGLPEGITIAVGTGDNMAAALRLGLEPGEVAVSLGTSGTVFAVTDYPTADPSGAVCGFADATGRHLPLVCTLNATKVTDAVGRLLGVDHDALAAVALEAPPGAGGLVLVPYLDGERTPDRPKATGLLAGIRSDVSRAQLARAAFEGVVCGLLDGLDALRTVGVEAGTGRTLLIGGGARSAGYRQVLADLTETEIVVPHEADYVAAGACVQAAAAWAGQSPTEVTTAWGRGLSDVVEPSAAGCSADVRAAYAAARDR
jgi:xylulokinase